jgi:hypothetical protein
MRSHTVQNRSKRRRLQFDSLEQRVTMSAALAHAGVAAASTGVEPAAHHVKNQAAFPVIEHRVYSSTTRAYPSAALAAQKVTSIKGTLKGGSSRVLAGNLVLIGGLSGNVGKVQFKATANAVVSGNTLLDGSMHFTNSQGTITASLGHGTLVKSGNTAQVKNVVFVFQQGTGSYAGVTGAAGDATFTFTKPKATAKAKTDAFEDSWEEYVSIGLDLLILSLSPELVYELDY